MAQRMLIGLGAAGTLAAAVTAGVLMRGDEKSSEPAAAAGMRASPQTVCIESNVRLVEGMTRECLTPSQYEALRDRAVVGGDGEPVEISLAAPGGGDGAAARTCAEFDSLTERGWYAPTGKVMRREEYFKRACGALSLLVKAEPAQSTHFDGGKASAGDVRSMALQDAIEFGEAAPSTAVAVTEIEDRVWKVAIGDGEVIVYEIAHADFTGDGLGEILAYVSVGAAGGTARTGSIGLMEKPAAGGACTFNAR